MEVLNVAAIWGMIFMIIGEVKKFRVDVRVVSAISLRLSFFIFGFLLCNALGFRQRL